MADPWVEVVRPIWPEVVDILNSIWTPELYHSFKRAAFLQECHGFRENPWLYPGTDHFIDAQSEICLVVASTGGETSFTAFLQWLESMSAGGELLGRELNKIWARKKRIVKKTTTNRCWQYESLSTSYAQQVLTSAFNTSIWLANVNLFSATLPIFSPSERLRVHSAVGRSDIGRIFLDILLQKNEVVLGIFVANARLHAHLIAQLELSAGIERGEKLEHVKQQVLKIRHLESLQELFPKSSASQVLLSQLEETVQFESSKSTRKSTNLLREAAKLTKPSTSDGSALGLQPKKGLSPEAQKSYDLALQGGERKVPHIRALFCGPGRVGKTCLGRSMLGLHFSPEVDSTIGVELQKIVCTVRRKKKTKMWVWRAEKDEDEQQRLLAKKVLKEEVRERQEAKAAVTVVSEVGEGEGMTGETKDEQQDGGMSAEGQSTLGSIDGQSTHQLVLQPGKDPPIAESDSFCLPDIAPSATQTEASTAMAHPKSSPSTVPIMGNDNSQPPDSTTTRVRHSSESEQKTKLQSEAVAHVRKFLKEIHRLTAETDSSLDDDMWFVDLWDFAGQESFAAVQHMLLSELRCVYAVIFDASLDLDAPAQTTFCLHGEEQPIEGASVVTNFDVVESWLNTIHQAVGDTDAPVYVIGCQIDKVPPEQREAKKKQVCDYIWRNAEDKAYRNNIDDILFVDNTVSGTSKEDPSITFLRQDLIKKMNEQLEMPIPLRWLPFTVAVRRLARRKDMPWLSMDQVSEVAHVVCGSDSAHAPEVDVMGLLQFHHHLGHVLHYAHNQYLNDRVIIDVEWLLKIVSLLFVPQVVSKQEKRFRRHFNLLREKGILLESLAQHIWSQHDERTAKYTHLRDQRDFLFHLMEEFSLLFNTGQDHVIGNCKPSRKFYIPALVTHVEDVSQVNDAPIQQSLPMYLFSGTTLLFPQTLFWCLVVRCMKHYQSEEDPVLYRNSARILCHEVFWLVVTYFQHGIKLVVEHDNRMSPLATVAGAADSIVLQDTCHSILLFAEAQLEELKGDALNHVVLQRAAHCDCALNKRPCRRHGTARCLQTDCRHFVKLVERQVPRCPLELKLSQDVAAVVNCWRIPLNIPEPMISSPNNALHVAEQLIPLSSGARTDQVAMVTGAHAAEVIVKAVPESSAAGSLEKSVGVHFKMMSDVTAARIFNEIAKEFAGRRSRIVSLLLGHPGNEELNLKRATTAAGHSECDLLFEGLNMWLQQTDVPTGSKLYDVLIDAGCPEGLVKKYKKPFQLPSSYTGGVSIF